MTFSFKHGLESIDEALHEIKATIFSILQEPLEWFQPDQSTQLHQALECYNVTINEGDEDPRNINSPESEGQHEVEGPKAEIHDISEPLKTKQVNIGLEAQPKFSNIGDYWDEDTVDKVMNLLREYQDLFPTKFSDRNGIVGALGAMKINLNLNARPVKERTN